MYKDYTSFFPLFATIGKDLWATDLEYGRQYVG